MTKDNVKELSDDFLDHVVGGISEFGPDNHTEEEGGCTCPICQRPATKVTHNGQVWGECDMHGIFFL